MAKSINMLSEYKLSIMNLLNNSKSIVELVGGTWVEDNPTSYAFKYFYPMEFLEDNDEIKTLVNFDISAQLNTNKTYLDISIFFYISSHINDIRTSSDTLKPDKIVYELTKLLNHKNVFGIGKGTIISNTPYKADNNFRGRMLTYKINDYS